MTEHSISFTNSATPVLTLEDFDYIDARGHSRNAYLEEVERIRMATTPSGKYPVFSSDDEVDEEKLEEIKLAMKTLEIKQRMFNMHGEEKAVQESPIRRIVDQINKDSEYTSELIKTLRDRLAPVLNQQPKVEQAGTSIDDSIAASSTLFNDLDNHANRIKRQNMSLLEIIEDLEI